uniref:Uncharacterized protein n=1 Tax=viral metagenome TaxID=1070528 RepID=A0A6H1ZME3_9ZZZZ
MKHFFDLRILPANIAGNEAILNFKIDKGLITWGGIYFPAGCHGRVYVRLIFQAHQILPRNQIGWCHGDNDWWDGNLYFPVTAHPLNIRVEAYADNCIFEHTVQIGLELMPWLMVPRWEELLEMLTEFWKELGIKIPPTTPQEMKM